MVQKSLTFMTRRVILFLTRCVIRMKKLSGEGEPMNLFKKSFLFVVGVVTIAFDEISKSIEEALATIEEQREKFNEQFG